MIGRRPIRLRQDSTAAWYQFRITREVRAWLEDPTSNHGLIVEATDDRGVPVVVVQTNRPEDEPFVSLVIHSTAINNSVSELKSALSAALQIVHTPCPEKKRPRYFQLQLSHFLVYFYNFCTIGNRSEYLTTICNLLT